MLPRQRGEEGRGRGAGEGGRERDGTGREEGNRGRNRQAEAVVVQEEVRAGAETAVTLTGSIGLAGSTVVAPTAVETSAIHTISRAASSSTSTTSSSIASVSTSAADRKSVV